MDIDHTTSASRTSDASEPTTTTDASINTSQHPAPEDMAAAVMSTRTISQSALPSLQTSDLNKTHSPPTSNHSSPTGLSPGVSQKRARSPLSIDLNNVPQLSSPAPPTNTLLITRLDDLRIFHPASLSTIRQHIADIAPLNSFSPLKSMRRIIVSFYDEASAIKVRQEIDRTAFSSSIAKCYFGEPTPLGDEVKFLERPDAGKLFFISPPPSPPVGWESREEEAPNKNVHAEDLASKLSALTGKMEPIVDSDISASPTTSTGDIMLVDEPETFTAEELSRVKALSQLQHRRTASLAMEETADSPSTPSRTRSRSSTLIYDPKVHGDSPGLPAVMLETHEDMEVELDFLGRGPMAHTSRPPVELMHE